MTQPAPDILRGTLDLLILKALSWGPAHGYGVARWIEQATNARARRRGGHVVSGASPFGGARLGDGGLGRVGREPAREVLRPLEKRPCPAPRRNRQLATVRRGRLRRAQGAGNAVTLPPCGNGFSAYSARIPRWTCGMNCRSTSRCGSASSSSVVSHQERARELAMRRFGDYDESRRECEAIDERRGRRMARTEYMTELRQDIGYAVRTLRRTPGFTAVAVATLALGIGANSAIFTVVHGVLLESLPFRDAERLHHVRILYPDGTTYLHVSAPDFVSVREENRVFEQVEAYLNGHSHDARQRRTQGNPGRERERWVVADARRARRARPRLPARGEPARPGWRGRPRRRILAARVRERPRGAGPQRGARRRALLDRRRARARRAATGARRCHQAAALRFDLQRDNRDRPAIGISRSDRPGESRHHITAGRRRSAASRRGSANEISQIRTAG